MTIGQSFIVITRPAHQADKLGRAVSDAGGTPLLFPTLAITAPPDPAAFMAIIDTLDATDKIIFLSPNAVEHSSAKITARWPILPARLQFFAVGSGTAAALTAARLPAAICPDSDFSSEGLLVLPELQAPIVQGQHIVLVHGLGGRTLLAETLTQRGAHIAHAIVYQRQPLHPNPSPVLAAWQAGQIQAIVITSQESLVQLVNILREPLQNHLQELPLLVISDRLAAFARSIGFKRLLIAQNASDTAIVAALLKGKRIMTDIKQQTVNKNSQPQKDTPRKTGAKIATGFAVIALLVACGSVAYSVLRANQLTVALQQQNTDNTAQTTAMLQQLQTHVTGTQQLLTQQMQQQQARINEQQKQIQQLLLTHNHAQSSWIIAEVDYLIQLANFNVIYQHNPATAVVLLKAADMTLNKINDPRLDAAHKAINSDITALGAVAITDKAALLSQLQTLINGVAHLTLITQTNAVTPTPATTQPTAATPAAKESFWKRAWETIKTQLEKIVIIHHSNTTLPPVLNQVAQTYVKQDLQILLTQAQLAVTQGNSDIYQMSLKQISSIVHQYFNAQAPSVQPFLQQLQQLQAVNLAPVIPALTASQQAIVQASQLVDQEAVEATPTAPVATATPVVTAPPAATAPISAPPVAATPAPPPAVPAPAPASTATPTPTPQASAAPTLPKNVAPPDAPHTPIMPNSVGSDHMSSGTMI